MGNGRGRFCVMAPNVSLFVGRDGIPSYGGGTKVEMRQQPLHTERVLAS